MNRIQFGGASALTILLSYICFCSISLSIGGECEQWPQHPEWLWCDDFEGNKTLKENYQDIDETGFSISTRDAFEGSHSLEQHYDSSQVGAGWIIRVNNEGFPSHLFMRWYHKFANGFHGFPPKMARMRYRQRSGDWKSTFGVHCWIDNNIVVADVSAKSSTQANIEGWLPIAKSSFSFNNLANIGRWVCFEMEVKLNTIGASDGLFRIWADDSMIVERTKVDLRGNENLLINEVMLDCYWNGGSPKKQNRYYDNFIISTQRIGPLHISTKAITTEPVKKNNGSNNKSPPHGFLKYHDPLSTTVYFTDNTVTHGREYYLDGRKSVFNGK